MVPVKHNGRIPLDALDWALKHLQLYSGWESFPAPFEYEAIGDNWDPIRAYLSRQASNWTLRCYRTCLSPKHRFGFRQVTQLDPLDSLILAALVYIVGPGLEKARTNKDYSLYFRFSPDAQGHLYERADGRRLFNDTCLERAKASSVTHIVEADIADFYPAVNFHRVEEALSPVSPRWAANLLLRILREINDNVSASLPVGPPFIHLIADATLTPLDSHLMAEGHEFVRLGDDFCFFCESYRDAWRALTAMANFLYEQFRLFLQPGKTRILKKMEYVEERTADPAQQAINRLEKLVQARAPELGLVDDYTGTPLDIVELDESTLDYLRELEWVEFLRNEIEGGFFSMQRIRYGLSRAKLFGVSEAANLILTNLELLAVVMREITGFLAVLKLSTSTQEAVCKQLLDATEAGSLGNTDYELIWIAHYLYSIASPNVGNNAGLLEFWRRFRGNSHVEREFLSGCTRHKYVAAVKSFKPKFRALTPWSRRALLHASSCLASDERRPWLRAIKRDLDLLEKAIVSWQH